MKKKKCIFTFLLVQPYKRPLRLNIMAFCPEHPMRDQNPKFTPLSETTSTQPLSYGSSPGGINNAYISLRLLPIDPSTVFFNFDWGQLAKICQYS